MLWKTEPQQQKISSMSIFCFFFTSKASAARQQLGEEEGWLFHCKHISIHTHGNGWVLLQRISCSILDYHFASCPKNMNNKFTINASFFFVSMVVFLVHGLYIFFPYPPASCRFTKHIKKTYTILFFSIRFVARPGHIWRI